MEIQTKYFGTFPFCDEDVIVFANGVFGFEDEKQFVLIRFDNENSTMLCLQSLQNPTLAFTVMNPFAFFPEYAPKLSEKDLQKMEKKESQELLFYNICVMQPVLQDSKVNLRCPIVVNPETRQAMQVILEDESYSFQHPFSKIIKED